MQNACIVSLMEIAEKDRNILYLTADSGEGGLDLMFRRNFPERSFNFGIAEENMVAAAAGLASSGKIPFVYAAAPFLAYRSFEFIRNDICLQALPVKLIGTGSGITVSSLGPTHHTTEDIAVLRSLPNLVIFSPSTPKQVIACMEAAYKHNGPVYIRLGMNKEQEYFNDASDINVYKNQVLKEGCNVAIFTTGSILEEVMKAAELLQQKGIDASVVNISCIKPFDNESVIRQATTAQILCTVEEHNVLGGVGSIISEILADEMIFRKLVKIGLDDSFSVGYGKLPQVRRENKFDAVSICEKINEVLK